MDINQLIHFQAAAKYENLTKAAAQLYITQSALSKSVRQLENELGICLFDRKGKSIVLNSSGKVVLKYTNHIVETVNMMNKELSMDLCARETQVSLATNRPVIVHNLFPKLIIGHPELNLRTKLVRANRSTVEQLLVSEIYDLMINSFSIQNSEIVSLFHSEEKLCLCVPKTSPLSSRKIIYKEDFKDMVIPATQYTYDTILKPLLEELKEKDISFNTFMIPDVATANYLMKISDIPSVYTDVAWSFNRFPNRVLVEIDGIPHRKNYINYLKKNETKVSYLVDLLMTEFKDFSD